MNLSFVAADVRRLKLIGRRESRASSPRLPRFSPLVTLVLTLIALAGCATGDGRLVRVSETADPQSYMRVARPSENTVALQISLRRFVPAKGNGPVVWLSGASHLGESNYFAALQRHLDTQPLVLFEGVGAKSKKMRFDPEEEVSIQHTMATALGLVFQLSAIDYDRPSFRNSDMTIAQLQQLLASGRGGGGARSTDAKAGEKFQELLNVMDGSSVLGTLMHMGLKFIGSNPKLQAMTKVLLVEILGELKGDMSQMQGMPPEIQRMMEVIIRERNKVVFDDLKAEMRSFGAPRSISVFYGAGHMADLEKRLHSELNYRPKDELWLTAISVNTREAGLSNTELEMMRGLIKWQMDAIRP